MEAVTHKLVSPSQDQIQLQKQLTSWTFMKTVTAQFIKYVTNGSTSQLVCTQETATESCSPEDKKTNLNLLHNKQPLR